MKHFKLFTFGLVIYCSTLTLSAQSSIRGQIIDQANNKTIPLAKIELYKDGELIISTHSDLSGNFGFARLAPGKYNIEGYSQGYLAQRKLNVILRADINIGVNMHLLPSGEALDDVCIERYSNPSRSHLNVKQGNLSRHR